MNHSRDSELSIWLRLCRLPEIRFGFFIFYLLLLAWPFMSDQTLSVRFLYYYYHTVWAILIVGLIIQGVWVTVKERHSQQPKQTPPPDDLP